MLVPFLVVISTSLASPDEVVANGGWVLWPQHPTLDAYRDIFRGGQVTKAIGVSIGVTLVGTLASLVATTLLAYALSRPQLVGALDVFPDKPHRNHRPVPLLLVGERVEH